MNAPPPTGLSRYWVMAVAGGGTFFAFLETFLCCRNLGWRTLRSDQSGFAVRSEWLLTTHVYPR